MGLDEDCILTEGSLIINTDDSASQDLSLMKYSERKKLCGRIIGHIAQDPEQAFMPVRSIEKQWIETLRDNDLYRRDEFKSTATEVLIKAGFTDPEKILSSRPYELSGGMRQRVAACLEFLLSPKLLLADEPTSALDEASGEKIASELLRLKKEQGCTEIVVTHNLELAGKIGDRILILKDGDIVETGNHNELMNKKGFYYELYSSQYK